MSKQEISNREKMCFSVLNSLGSTKYVLVGGYAVSSFDFPRFSVDLDIVIPKSELAIITSILEKMGFSRTEELSGFDRVYSGSFERHKMSSKFPIAIDFLINSITSRQTGFSYSFDYLLKNSEIREIRGWGQGLKSTNRVPNREMLLALKINSMRTSDKRDVIALCYDLPDIDRISMHLKNCNRTVILSNINGLLGMLESNHHKDSIKGVFTLPEKSLNHMVNNCKLVLERISDILNANGK